MGEEVGGGGLQDEHNGKHPGVSAGQENWSIEKQNALLCFHLSYLQKIILQTEVMYNYAHRRVYSHNPII